LPKTVHAGVIYLLFCFTQMILSCTTIKTVCSSYSSNRKLIQYTDILHCSSIFCAFICLLCVCVCMWVCMCLYVSMCVYMCICACVYVYICVYMCVCMCVCMCVYGYVCVCRSLQIYHVHMSAIPSTVMI
jgi:hypothetical protein